MVVEVVVLAAVILFEAEDWHIHGGSQSSECYHVVEEHRHLHSYHYADSHAVAEGVEAHQHVGNEHCQGKIPRSLMKLLVVQSLQSPQLVQSRSLVVACLAVSARATKRQSQHQ